MIIQAELRRKQSEYEGEACVVDKVIELPAQRFKQFSRALLADYDFIAENKNAIQHNDNARHCLLILDTDGTGGFLVDPQGYNYARYDGIIPQAAEFADLPAELETFNHFAEVVENMPSREKQLPKFKAVLRICQCSSVDQAISLAERLEHFYFDAKIKNYADLVYDELENIIGDRQAEELRQCLDIEKYGRILHTFYLPPL